MDGAVNTRHPTPSSLVPAPSVIRRQVDSARYQQGLGAGLVPLVARVLASRGNAASPPVTKLLSPPVSALDDPYGLPDIECAANRIALAVTQEEPVVIFADYDVDGSSSATVWWRALVDHFGVKPDFLRVEQGHRLTEGYGLTDTAVNKILALAPRPELVLTCDCGTSDEARIARLAEASIDVIVLDHHEMPVAGPPKSAFACVTPMRPDSRYPDPCICGATVSWLTACVVRRVLMDIDYLPRDTPHLGDLLDVVALASVADCMSLVDSVNNRALILAGLELINAQARPCWQVACAALGRGRPLTERDLAFGVGPRINSAGRIEHARRGLKFLLSATYAEACQWWEQLDQQNNERRQIERRLLSEAMGLAAHEVELGRRGLVIRFAEGHAGVQGIVAQRIMQAFGCPTVCLSEKLNSEGRLAGSARSAQGIDIKRVFDQVAAEAPDVVLHHGGHRAAAGCEIDATAGRPERFAELFDSDVKRAAPDALFAPVLLTDGDLREPEFSLDTVDALAALRPYGKDFDPPLFDGRMTVAGVRVIGDGTHLKLVLRTARGTEIDAVWFGSNAPGGAPPCRPGEAVRVVYTLDANTFRGKTSLQLQVRALFQAEA